LGLGGKQGKKPRRLFKPPVLQVLNVHSSADGRLMLSGSKSGEVWWWDCRYPGQPVRTLAVGNLPADGQQLAAAPC
jgi:hypothetical protein